MRDFEFQPAVPALVEALPPPTGRSAVLAHARFDTNGASALITACQSKNSTTRMNTAFGLEQVRDLRTVKPLLVLLTDKTPGVRMHAARGGKQLGPAIRSANGKTFQGSAAGSSLSSCCLP